MINGCVQQSFVARWIEPVSSISSFCVWVSSIGTRKNENESLPFHTCDVHITQKAIDRTKKRPFLTFLWDKEKRSFSHVYLFERTTSIFRSFMLTVTPQWNVPYLFKGAKIIQDRCPWTDAERLTDLLKDKLLSFRIGKQQQSLFGRDFMCER